MVSLAGSGMNFEGMVVCLGAVEELIDPKFVSTMVGPEAPLATAGRSLKIESPFRSVPVVMLKGDPAFATMNGLNLNPCGKETVPPRKMRWRTSKAARP